MRLRRRIGDHSNLCNNLCLKTQSKPCTSLLGGSEGLGNQEVIIILSLIF